MDNYITAGNDPRPPKQSQESLASRAHHVHTPSRRGCGACRDSVWSCFYFGGPGLCCRSLYLFIYIFFLIFGIFSRFGSLGRSRACVWNCARSQLCARVSFEAVPSASLFVCLWQRNFRLSASGSFWHSQFRGCARARARACARGRRDWLLFFVGISHRFPTAPAASC